MTHWGAWASLVFCLLKQLVPKMLCWALKVSPWYVSRGLMMTEGGRQACLLPPYLGSPSCVGTFSLSLSLASAPGAARSCPSFLFSPWADLSELPWHAITAAHSDLAKSSLSTTSPTLPRLLTERIQCLAMLYPCRSTQGGSKPHAGLCRVSKKLTSPGALAAHLES